MNTPDVTPTQWLSRNLLTVAGLLFAAGAFISDLAGALPGNVGTHAAEIAFGCTAAARGLVHAVRELRTDPEAER